MGDKRNWSTWPVSGFWKKASWHMYLRWARNFSLFSSTYRCDLPWWCWDDANKCILIDELTLGFEIIIYLWVEALYSAVAWILKGLSLVERVFEVTWCASTTSLQLTLFLVGLRGICTGSRHMEGTFVPEGCALTLRPPSEHLGLFRREQKLFPPRKNPTGST
jgi:hypothetical protein